MWRMINPLNWNLQWKWIIWQVAVPILSPIGMSVIFVYLWESGQPGFIIRWPIIIDVSPWALIFYSTTLIGATMHDFSPKFSDHQALGYSLIATAIAVVLYAGFIVIWRHDPKWNPGVAVTVSLEDCCWLQSACAIREPKSVEGREGRECRAMEIFNGS